MKTLFNSDMEKIKEKCKHFKSEMIIIESGKNDKDMTINYLMKQLTYLYMKLGVYEDS